MVIVMHMDAGRRPGAFCAWLGRRGGSRSSLATQLWQAWKSGSRLTGLYAPARTRPAFRAMHQKIASAATLIGVPESTTPSRNKQALVSAHRIFVYFLYPINVVDKTSSFSCILRVRVVIDRWVSWGSTTQRVKPVNNVPLDLLVCPLTKTDRGYPFHIAIADDPKMKGFVMVEQVKSIDFHARQAKLIGKASDHLLDEVLSILDACIY